MQSRCGCEFGGPCTRATLCAVNAVQDQLDEARADLENERAMRAGEHDDTHSRIEKLHAELVESRAELAKAKETLRDCYEQADGGLQAEHDCPAVFACSCILVDTMEALGIEPPSAAPAASEPKP